MRRPLGRLARAMTQSRSYGVLTDERSLFVLQAIVLCVFALLSRSAVELDQPLYLAYGTSIANGLGMMARDGQATAFVTPGFPLIVAAFVAIFDNFMLPAIQVFQALLLALTALIARRSARLVGIRTQGEPFVQLLVGFFPPMVLLVPLLMTETSFHFLAALASFVIVQMYAIRASSRTIWLAVALAVIVCLAIAVRPTGVLFVPATMGACLYALVRKEWQLARRAGASLVACILGVALFTVPWGLRNASALGAFVPFSTSGSYVAFCGNLVPAQGVGAAADRGLQRDWTQYVPAATVTDIAAMGQVEKSQAFGRLLAVQVHEDPLGVAQLWALKLPRLWFNLGFPDPPSRASLLLASFNALTIVAASVGSVRLFRSGGPANRAMIVLLIGYMMALTALHVATFAVVRYALSGFVVLFMFAPEGAITLRRRRS